jgi:rubrerythrin
MDYYHDTYGPGYASPRADPPVTAAVPPEDLFSYPENFQNALTHILDATGGETADRQFYTWLIGHAPSNEDQQIITGIRDDEIGHYGLFRRLYTQLTGQNAPPVPEEAFTPPSSYCEGLARALMGEQNAVRKYRQILYAMQTRVHFNTMTQIITDELRHGLLYSYLYARNGCRGV